MEDFVVDHGGVEILKVRPENEQSQDAIKKLRPFLRTVFENDLPFANHAIFATEVSRQFNPPKHVKSKVLKIL